MLSYSLERSTGPVTYRRHPGDTYLRSSSVSLTHSGSSSFHSQSRSRRSAPSYSESPEPSNGPRNEKEALQGLNERFAGYIDKVRRLEEQNHNLQQEAAALRKQQVGVSAMGQIYDREIREMRNQLLKINSENGQEQLERDRLNEDIELLRMKTQEEQRLKEEALAAERALRQFLQECNLDGEHIAKKVQALEEEAAHLCKSHQEDVEEILMQIQGCQVTTQQLGEVPRWDLASALKDIRAQLEGHIGRNTLQTQEWFQAKLDKLNEASHVNTQAIHSASDEITTYRHQLQSQVTQLEVLKSSQQSLERQCMDMEDRHQAEMASYQDTLQQLENELRNTKWEMATQIREYQDLLNVKMALDIEIAAYRKLLEGEESRIGSGFDLYPFDDRTVRIPSTPKHVKVKKEEKIKIVEKSDKETVIVEKKTEETHVTEEEEKIIGSPKGVQDEDVGTQKVDRKVDKEIKEEEPGKKEEKSKEKEPVKKEEKGPSKEETKGETEIKDPTQFEGKGPVKKNGQAKTKDKTEQVKDEKHKPSNVQEKKEEQVKPGKLDDESAADLKPKLKEKDEGVGKDEGKELHKKEETKQPIKDEKKEPPKKEDNIESTKDEEMSDKQKKSEATKNEEKLEVIKKEAPSKEEEKKEKVGEKALKADEKKPAKAEEKTPSMAEGKKSDKEVEKAKEAPAKSDEKSAEETKPAKAEETKPAKAEETKPAKAEETKPAKAEETKPAKAEETKPAKAEETKPAKAEETKPAKAAEAKPAKVEETKPAKAEQTKPAKAEETKPAKAEETKPAKAEETKPAKAEETRPAKAEETRPAKAEETKPAKAEETKPAKADDKTAKVVEKPGKAKEKPSGKTEEKLSPDAENKEPIKVKDLPKSKTELPQKDKSQVTEKPQKEDEQESQKLEQKGKEAKVIKEEPTAKGKSKTEKSSGTDPSETDSSLETKDDK